MLTADERVKRRWLHLIKLFITQILHNQNRNHQIFLKWVNLLLDQYPTPQGLILQFSKLDHLIREGFLHLLYKGGVRHLNLIYIWLIWMISEYDVWFMLKLIYSRFSLNIDESSLNGFGDLVGLIEVDESFGSVADNQNKNNSWKNCQQ